MTVLHWIQSYRYLEVLGLGEQLQWATSTVRAPVFDRHQFFGTSEHYGKAHGSLSYGWMNYNYTACCWFPTSSNVLILPSQFWQMRFESCWLHCSKCRILVLLRYLARYRPTSTQPYIFKVEHHHVHVHVTTLHMDTHVNSNVYNVGLRDDTSASTFKEISFFWRNLRNFERLKEFFKEF